MERVLVTGAAHIGKAGVATIVYKWGQQFDSNVLVYDYLMQSGLPEKCYVDAIRRKGGKIYTMKGQHNFLSVIRWVEGVIRKHHYKTIHINSDSAYVAAAYIYAAKKGGIKNIFVHSHCTQIDDNRNWVRNLKIAAHKICMPYVRKNTKMYLACSEIAGEWMFGKGVGRSEKYKTIYNGIEAERYLFNEEIRSRYRNQLGLEDCIVIGNVGRFSFQKNHDFLIDIFSELLKDGKEYRLVLVGTGELEEKVRSKVELLGISDFVLFLGQRNDVPELMSAMDVLVMPSRFEGLPVTMVEAQMASLPCVVSANITREAKFIDDVEYVPLDDMELWKNKIKKYGTMARNITVVPKDCLYDIKNASADLERILIK